MASEEEVAVIGGEITRKLDTMVHELETPLKKLELSFKLLRVWAYRYVDVEGVMKELMTIMGCCEVIGEIAHRYLIILNSDFVDPKKQGVILKMCKRN